MAKRYPQNHLAKGNSHNRRKLFLEQLEIRACPGGTFGFEYSGIIHGALTQGNCILIALKSAQNAFQEVFVPAGLQSFAAETPAGGSVAL